MILFSYREEITKLKKAIFEVEKDRERLANEVTDHRANILQAQEDIKLKDIQIGK